ncbi:2389_t:CDS:1, partial [Racocetra persica]
SSNPPRNIPVNLTVPSPPREKQGQKRTREANDINPSRMEADQG